MSAAFDRLSASVDAAVAKLSTVTTPGNGVTDDQLNALADKLDAAVAGPVEPAPEPTLS